MSFFRKAAHFAVLFLLIAPYASHSQSLKEVSIIDSLLFPINIRPQGGAEQKLFPENLMNDKAVIGLGESTHGTREFNVYRAEFIKDQILHNNVRTVAVETDYCQSIILNDYLTSDLPNSKDSLMKKIYNSWLYGIYQTQEVFDLYSWIKDHNLKLDKSERVSVLGMDMQYPGTISDRILAAFPALETIDSISYNNLVRLKKLYSSGQIVTLSEDDLVIFRQIPIKLDSIAETLPLPDTASLQQLARLLSQTLSLQESPGFFTKVHNHYRSMRDQFMAENVIWLHENSPANSKLIVWSHNGHIAHAKYGGTFRMGYHLQAALGERYFAIGAFFDEGSVRIFDFDGINKYKSFSYSSSSKTNSIEYLLKGSSEDAFFLDIHRFKENGQYSKFLSNYPYTRVIGARYQPKADKDFFKEPVIEGFDALVFFRKANAAEDMK